MADKIFNDFTERLSPTGNEFALVEVTPGVYQRVKLSNIGVTGGGGGTQLSTPGSFVAADVSSSQINLTWTDVANESSYRLEWSPNGTTGWTQIGGIIAAGTTSYNHTGLTASTTYYYRLKAVGDGVTYTDSNYATANDTTQAGGVNYLTWQTLSADHEQITTNQGVRKETGTGNAWGTTANISISNQTISTGERLVWRAGAGANKSLAYIVSLSTNQTATLANGAPGLPFGIYCGVGLAPDSQANESGTSASSILSSFADDLYFSIFYDGSQIKYQTSVDGSAWTNRYTSLVSPSGSYYVQFHPYSELAGPIRIYKE